VATRTWTNGNATGIWSDPLNWSGGSKPGPSDDVVFDATDVSQCTIDEPVSVQSIDAKAAYTGAGTSGKLVNTTYAVAVSGDAIFDNKEVDFGSATYTVGGDFDLEHVGIQSIGSADVVLTGSAKSFYYGSNVLNSLTIQAGASYTTAGAINSGALAVTFDISGTFTITVTKDHSCTDLQVLGTGQLTGAGQFHVNSGNIYSLAGTTDIAGFFIEDCDSIVAGTIASATVKVSESRTGTRTLDIEAGAHIISGNIEFEKTALGTWEINHLLAEGWWEIAGNLTLDIQAGSFDWQEFGSGWGYPQLIPPMNRPKNGIIWLTGGGSGTQTVDADSQNMGYVIVDDSGATKQLTATSTFRKLYVANGLIDFNGKTVTAKEHLGVYNDNSSFFGNVVGTGLNGSTINVNRSIVVQGNASTDIDFDASANWNLNVVRFGQGWQAFVYCDFGNCQATGEKIDATDASNTDSGSNSEVYFSKTTRTWDGGGGDTSWGTAANWSGDTVPGPFDTAVFDGTSAKNCNVNSTRRVGTIQTYGTYAGTFDSTSDDVDVFDRAEFANATVDLGGGNVWRVGSYVDSGITTFTAPGRIEFHASFGDLEAPVARPLGEVRVYGSVGTRATSKIGQLTAYAAARPNTDGRMVIGSGDPLYVDGDITVQANAGVGGRDDLHLLNPHDVIQQDGTFDPEVFYCYGQTDLAAGTYSCDETHFQNDQGSAQPVRLSQGTSGGTVRFTREVYFEITSAQDLNVWNNVNNPNLYFERGFFIDESGGSGSVNWTRGSGGIVLDGSLGMVIGFTLDPQGKTMEYMEFKAGGLPPSGFSSFKFLSGVTCAALRIKTDCRVDFNGQSITTDGNFDIDTGGDVFGSGLDGCAFDVNGNFDVNGTPTTKLDLVAGATWTLDVAGTAKAYDVEVAYSDASAGTQVRANASIDQGNNLNWEFLDVRGEIAPVVDMPGPMAFDLLGEIAPVVVLDGYVAVPRFITGEVTPVAVLTVTFGEGYLYAATIDAEANLLGAIRYEIGPGNDPESRARALGYRSSHVLIVHAIEATHPDDLTAANLQTGDSFLVSAAYVGSPGDPFFDAGAKAGSLGIIAENASSVQYYIFREPIEKEVVWYVQRGSLVEIGLYRWESEAWLKYSSLPQRAFAALRIFEQLDPDNVYDYYAKIMGSAYWEWSYDSEYLLNFIDPQKCPAEFLPELARQFGLAVEHGESEAVRRQRIELAIPEYKLKGLALSVFLRLRALGYIGYSHEIYVDPEDAANWYAEADAPTYIKNDIAARGLTGQIPTDTGQKGQEFIEVPHGYLTDEPSTYWPSSRVSIHINKSDGTPMLGLLEADIEALKEEVSKQLTREVLPIHLDIRYFVTDAHVEDSDDTVTVADELEALIDGYPYDEFDRGDGPVA